MREVAARRGAFILAPDPYLYFARLTQMWKQSHARPEGARIHPSAVIDPDAHIDPARASARYAWSSGVRASARRRS